MQLGLLSGGLRGRRLRLSTRGYGYESMIDSETRESERLGDLLTCCNYFMSDGFWAFGVLLTLTQSKMIVFF
jgi:hypothetical protein